MEITNVGWDLLPPEKFVAEGFIPSEKQKNTNVGEDFSPPEKRNVAEGFTPSEKQVAR